MGEFIGSMVKYSVYYSEEVESFLKSKIYYARSLVQWLDSQKELRHCMLRNDSELTGILKSVFDHLNNNLEWSIFKKF